MKITIGKLREKRGRRLALTLKMVEFARCLPYNEVLSWSKKEHPPIGTFVESFNCFKLLEYLRAPWSKGERRGFELFFCYCHRQPQRPQNEEKSENIKMISRTRAWPLVNLWLFFLLIFCWRFRKKPFRSSVAAAASAWMNVEDLRHAHSTLKNEWNGDREGERELANILSGIIVAK